MAPPKKIKDTADSEAPRSNLGHLKRAIKDLLKDKDPIISVDPESFTQSLPSLSSGSFVLDYQIGGKPNKHGVSPCPGFPKGMLVNIYGAESCGKTTLALSCAAQVCAAGGTVLYIDWEHAVDLRYAQALGVPVHDDNKFLFLQPQTLEDGFKSALLGVGAVNTKKFKLNVDLIVFDSIGAGLLEAAKDVKPDEQGKLNRPGLMATKWSQFLPNLIGPAKHNETTVIGISQLRKTMSTMSGASDTSTIMGGDAWKYYSAVRINLYSVKNKATKTFNPLTNEWDEAFTSNCIYTKLDKCKIASTNGSKANFHITYGEGIDNVRSMIDIGIKNKIMALRGAWYAFPRSNGTEVLGCGMQAFKTELQKAPGALKELQDAVWAALLAMPETSQEEEKEKEYLSDEDVENIAASMGN